MSQTRNSRSSFGSTMLLLASVISGTGYSRHPKGFGGVSIVNRLVLGALSGAGMTGAVVALHDTPEADWVGRWPGAVCASGSRLRFVSGALARGLRARGSYTFVTHVDLMPVGRLVKSLYGGRLYGFLHGVEVWDP